MSTKIKNSGRIPNGQMVPRSRRHPSRGSKIAGRPVAQAVPDGPTERVARLRTALYRGASLQECFGFWEKLEPNLQLRCYELLFRDRVVNKGIERFLSNPASLAPTLLYLNDAANDLREVLQRRGGIDLQAAHREFSRLQPDQQFRCYELLCRDDLIREGVEEFLRNPAALLRTTKVEGEERPVIDHLLYEASGGVSLDEMVSVLTAPNTPLPRPVATLVARYAMERFDNVFFGPEQWKAYYGVTPVNLRGQEEHPTPSQALYDCLNSRMRPGEKLAGFTCAVTYIPGYVNKNHEVIPVTSRTLGLELGPHPIQGSATKFTDHNLALDRHDADLVQDSCYFVMELEFAPNTNGKRPSDLIPQISQVGDERWEFPDARNFIATVFSRRVWKGQFLYGANSCPSIGVYIKEKQRDGRAMTLGCFGINGLGLGDPGAHGSRNIGAVASKKFLPVFTAP